MKYQVSIMTINTGMTEVEASSLGEAYELAQDLTAGDFEFINGSEEWREVTPIQ